jgi:hypothetical protein
VETCDQTEAAVRSGAGIEELRRPVDLQGIVGTTHLQAAFLPA